MFSAENPDTNEHALFYMRLDVPDPLSTLDVLIEGPWRVNQSSESDGRFAPIVEPFEQDYRYVDFAFDPPVVHKFDPAAFGVRLLEDSSGWLVKTHDDLQDRDLLWSVPLEPDGSLGVAELLTPLSAPNLQLLFPHFAISADKSTMAVAGRLVGDPSPYRMYTIDLLDPSDSPTELGLIKQEHGIHSPDRLHLTPDGGELIFEQTIDFTSEVWWFDVDGVPGQQFLTQGAVFDWAADDRTGLWADLLPPFERKWIEVGEASISISPIDVPGTEQAVTLWDGGTQVMIRTDDAGGSVYMGDVLGPYSPVLGAAAGEAALSSANMAVDDTHVLVNYRLPNDNIDVTLVELVDNVVVASTIIAANSPITGSWNSFAEHAVVHFGNIDQLWLLDYDDPGSFTELTGVLPPFAVNLSWAYSANGDYLLYSDDVDKNYYLYRTSAPGPVELVDLGPYMPSRSVAVGPWEFNP